MDRQPRERTLTLLPVQHTSWLAKRKAGSGQAVAVYSAPRLYNDLELNTSVPLAAHGCGISQGAAELLPQVLSAHGSRHLAPPSLVSGGDSPCRGSPKATMDQLPREGTAGHGRADYEELDA
jgi:hypothetical protein